MTNETRLMARQLLLEYLQRVYKLLKATEDIDNHKLLDQAREKTIKLLSKEILCAGDVASMKRYKLKQKGISEDLDDLLRLKIGRVKSKALELKTQLQEELGAARSTGSQLVKNWSLQDPFTSSMKIIAQYSS